MERVISRSPVATVWKGMYKGRNVSVTVMNDRDFMREFFVEIELYCCLTHPCLMHTYGYISTPTMVALVQEWLPIGNLHEYLFDSRHQWKNRIDLLMTVKIASDIAHGMKYLHAEEIIHWELQPKNILVYSTSPEADIHVKITNWNFAKNSVASVRATKFTQGLPMYTAPEVVTQPTYTKSIDVFSFGMIFYEILTGLAPALEGYPSSWDAMQALLQGVRPPITPSVPVFLAHIVTRCWDHDPNARPEFAQICTELQSCINLISVTNVLRGDISAAAKVVAIFDKMDPLPWNTFALQMVTLYPRLQPDSLEQLKTCAKEDRVALRDLKAYLRSTLEIDLDQLSLRGPGKGEKPVAAWSTDDIAAWLSSIGLGAYKLNFQVNMVTGEQLLAMPSEDLKNRLEIIPLGVRKTILREIKAAASGVHQRTKAAVSRRPTCGYRETPVPDATSTAGPTSSPTSPRSLPTASSLSHETQVSSSPRGMPLQPSPRAGPTPQAPPPTPTLSRATIASTDEIRSAAAPTPNSTPGPVSASISSTIQPPLSPPPTSPRDGGTSPRSKLSPRRQRVNLADAEEKRRMSFMQAPLTPPPSLSSSPDRELIPPLSTLSRSTVVQFDTERVPRTPAPTAAPQPSTRTPPEPTTLSRATVVSGMSAQPSATTLSRSTVADSAAHEPVYVPRVKPRPMPIGLYEPSRGGTLSCSTVADTPHLTAEDLFAPPPSRPVASTVSSSTLSGYSTMRRRAAPIYVPAHTGLSEYFERNASQFANSSESAGPASFSDFKSISGIATMKRGHTASRVTGDLPALRAALNQPSLSISQGPTSSRGPETMLKVHFPDRTVKQFPVDANTTAGDLLEVIRKKFTFLSELGDVANFALFESLRLTDERMLRPDENLLSLQSRWRGNAPRFVLKDKTLPPPVVQKDLIRIHFYDESVKAFQIESYMTVKEVCQMVERRMASLQTDAASYGLWLKDSSGIRLLNPEDNLWLLRSGFEANARLVYSKVVPV